MKSDTKIQRCKKCNLPANYYGINFEADGVCNYCKRDSKTFKYPGLDALKKDINEILSKKNPNRRYDCAVGISGGRDSSYLLYFAKEVLGLRVLAVSMVHDFMPIETRNNIKTIVERLGVDIHYIQNDALNKSSRQCVKNWMKNPDPAMCITFCTGCRYGVNKVMPDYIRKEGIPLLLVGLVPIENIKYRQEIFCDNRKVNTINKIIGYAKRIFKNPSYFLSFKSFYYQIYDFISYNKYLSKPFPVQISPFYYIEWNEDVIISKIKELGWGMDEGFNATWRSDCYVNTLRQYLYKKGLGYNDIDAYYATLLREDKIDRTEAIRRIKEEGSYSEDNIRMILKDFYDIDYDYLMNRYKTVCNLF